MAAGLGAQGGQRPECSAQNATIDWTVRESARANLRRLVRRVLNQYGYPPDKQEAATQTVLEQAQLFGFELLSYRRLLAPRFRVVLRLSSPVLFARSSGEDKGPESPMGNGRKGVRPCACWWSADARESSGHERI